jgi:hypothetical protein
VVDGGGLRSARRAAVSRRAGLRLGGLRDRAEARRAAAGLTARGPRLHTARMRKVLLLALLALSCGDEKAVEKCQAFRDVFCRRAVDCKAVPDTFEVCQQQFATRVVDCGQAQDVGGSYDRCISEMNAFSCQVLFPSTGANLPQSCNGAILK